MSLCDEIGCRYQRLCAKPGRTDSFERDIGWIRGLDIEYLLFRLQRNRRVIKYEMVPHSRLGEVLDSHDGYVTFSYPQQVSQERLEGVFGSGFSEQVYVVLVARKRDSIRSFLEVEFHSPDISVRRTGAGRYLGYPACCIRRLLHLKSRGMDTDLVQEEERFSAEDARCPLINSVLKLYLHKPCSPVCEETIRVAQIMLRYLEETYGEGAVRNYFSYLREHIRSSLPS